jgi:hypothetical protein
MFLIIAGALVLSMLFTMVPAYASPIMSISGTFIGISPPTYGPARKAGANVFLSTEIPPTGKYNAGPILGTYYQYTDVIWHFGDPETVKNLPENSFQWTRIPSVAIWHMERFFTGTVDGKSGTFTMLLKAKFTYPTITYPSLEGTWVIISGTGELANLHGQGTWWNNAGQILGYAGQIHFDP